MPTCCGKVIENTALGKSFFVCTKCKQEVTSKTLEEYILESLDFVKSDGSGVPQPISVELAPPTMTEEEIEQTYQRWKNANPDLVKDALNESYQLDDPFDDDQLEFPWPISAED